MILASISDRVYISDINLSRFGEGSTLGVSYMCSPLLMVLHWSSSVRIHLLMHTELLSTHLNVRTHIQDINLNRFGEGLLWGYSVLGFSRC